MCVTEFINSSRRKNVDNLWSMGAKVFLYQSPVPCDKVYTIQDCWRLDTNGTPYLAFAFSDETAIDCSHISTISMCNWEVNVCIADDGLPAILFINPTNV